MFPEWLHDIYFFENEARRENLEMYEFCKKYKLYDFWEEFYANRKGETRHLPDEE